MKEKVFSFWKKTSQGSESPSEGPGERKVDSQSKSILHETNLIQGFSSPPGKI